MIQVTLVLALGLAATMVLRRRSAALRHWVLAGAIACAALMPLAEAVAPAWQLPLLPASSSRLAPGLSLGDAPGRDAASAAGATQTIVSSSPAILSVLRTAWVLGAGLSLLLLGIGIARLLVVASRARPVSDGRWAAESAALAERYGLKRPPAVLQTRHPTLLFTWGLRQPKVLVPRDAASWSDERIRIVLGHELAHVRRGDWAVQLLADGVRSAYWFNPLVWIACWRLRLESEHACDDAVLRLGVAAPDYATQLLDLARLFRHSRRSFFPAPAMARPSDLERRVRVMLNERMDRSPVGRLSGWLVALGLVALTVPIAGLSLSAGDTPTALRPEPAASVSLAVAAPETLPAATRPVSATSVPSMPLPAPAAVTPRVVEPTRAADNPPQALGPAKFVVSVTDQLGRSVPNASVVVISSGLLVQIADGTTDQGGEFTAPSLTDGHFQLTVIKPGFKTLRMNVKLEPGKTTTSRVTLQLGMLAETIVVSAQAGVAATGTFAPQARHIGAAPAEDPCSQSAEGGCVTPPRKLVDAKPVYPAWLVEAGTSGTVVVDAKVLTDGSVGSLQPAQGADPDLADAAMRAIRLWQFSPVRLNGVPMEVQLEVTVKFEVVKK
jgi:TonB family protein